MKQWAFFVAKDRFHRLLHEHPVACDQWSDCGIAVADCIAEFNGRHARLAPEEAAQI